MNLNSKHIYDYYGYRVGDHTRCRNGKCCNLISVGCIQWDFKSTELYNKKETLEEILRKIEKPLLSSFPISNIGGGYKLYAGVHNEQNTFRTLAAADGIVITQNAETIQIGFDTSTIPPQGVTSVAMTVPTGFQVTGSPITTAGVFNIQYAAGYQGYTTAESNKLAGIEAGAQANVPETDPTVPSYVKAITTSNISNWNTAFGWGDHSTAGYATQIWTIAGFEPKFTKNTAFNKNFGTVEGTVSEGNHTHNYSDIQGIPTENSENKMLHYWNNSVKEWISSKIEFISNGIVKLKALIFDGYTIAERDAIASPTEGMIIYQKTDKKFQHYNGTEWKDMGGLPTPPSDGIFIVKKNGQLVSYEDATYLEQNIANTNLTTTGERTLTQAHPYIHATDGKPFFITNLPDKSADATFVNFLGQDNAGQFAKVGYPAFKKQVEDWTQQQRNEFSQLLNGGFSVGSISVNMISPPVFEQEDNDVYIVLRGANLNLHPTQRKIELLDANTENILAEIPVSQIQTYSSGTELIFYYNFNSIGTGVYKLRITSGVNVFVTTQNFQIVSSVTNIDLSSNTFDILTSYSNTLSFATNDTVLFENEIEGENSTVPIFSAKSSELFSQGEDFYLEVLVDNQNNITGSANTRIAIGYSNSTNQLVYTGLSYFGIYHAYINSHRKMIRVNTRTKNHGVSSESVVGSVIFIKQGNLLTTLFNDLITTETISNNSGYSLFFQAPNRVNKETTSIQIIKAYKF